jgi:myo-inositol-1(or 4)-monophosphatase
MRPALSDLEKLARQAGGILREGFHQTNVVNHKGEIDLITEIDMRSETFLLEEIASKYPEHRVVAEESGGVEGADTCVWFIDPLDGTTNFAHKLPIFSVSIAFEEDGELALGVVYDPMHDECFSAERGKGAWLNGESIAVGSTVELSKSLLVTGFPYDRFVNPDNNLDHFNHFALQVQGIRRLGSAALDLCFVACGRVDGFWEIRLQPWDLAAGTLIARESGARVTKLDGSPNTYNSAPFNVVAANPKLHEKMMGVLNGKSGKNS